MAISEAQEEWWRIRGDTAAVEKRIEKLQLRGSGSKESCLVGGWSALTSDPVSLCVISRNGDDDCVPQEDSAIARRASVQ